MSKKKSKKELEKWWENYNAKSQKRKEHLDKATSSIMRWCKKHYKNPREHMDGHIVLARALEHFDLEDSKEVGQLYLEWLVDEFATKKFIDNIPDIDFIYQQLVEKGYDEENSFEFNDMDNHLFYIPTDYIDNFKRRYQVFAMTTQNTNFLVVRKIHNNRVLADNDTVCFYQYWDQYDFESQEEWDVKEMNSFKKEGINKAILMAEWITERYSDNIPGRKYEPNRPDLKWYKENNFKSSMFGGHIFEVGEIGSGNATIYNFGIIKYAIFYLRFSLEQLIDMEKEK